MSICIVTNSVLLQLIVYASYLPFYLIYLNALKTQQNN